MPLDRWANPALLIVDMQNDFVREGAAMEVPDARSTIPQHQRLVAFCRQAGLPVIYTRFLATAERTMLWEWSPELDEPLFACRPGYMRHYPDIDQTRNCVDVIDEIYPQPGDRIVDKYGYGAFHGTDLDNHLRSSGIESLVVTGTVTQICVEETARQAFHYGYKTTTVSDAVSSYLPNLHAGTLENLARKFGWISTTDEVLEALATRFGIGGQREQAEEPQTAPAPVRT